MPLESDRRLPSLACSPEELQQADDYRISSFLSYKSSETGEGSFCFIEVFEHRETDSRSKIRWIFPGDGGFELGVEGFLPRIRLVYPENAPAALPTATYGVCDQLYNLFVELISIGLILVELGYIGLLTVITIPLVFSSWQPAVAFDVLGYLVLGLDIACFLIQSILQFFF